MLRYKTAPICFLTLTAVCIMSTSSASADQGRFLYVQSNGILEGQNSIIAFERLSNGKLKPILGSPFLTGGTGMNNNTYAKVGPHDNDTPIVLSANGKRLFSVNTHSNTIAAFDILSDVRTSVGYLLTKLALAFTPSTICRVMRKKTRQVRFQFMT
jgi:hypothetical protein